MRGHVSVANPRLLSIGVSLLGLIAAIFFGRAVAIGDVKMIYALFVFSAGSALVLGMGNRYWLLAPLGFALNLPLLPLGGRAFEVPEVTSIGVFGVFVLMVALHRNVVHLGKVENAGVFLFVALVATIYALYPVGLLAGGSSIVGGRFYFKVFLGFLVYIALTNQHVEDRDASWIIKFFLFGSLLSMGWGLIDYFVLGNQDGVDVDGFYSWHQILAGPPFIFSIWIFSKFKPSQVFCVSRPILPALYILAILMAFASGKRAMVAAILFIPIISCVLHRQYRYAYLAAALILSFFAIVMLGQGNVFSLPRSAQRALMYLPAHWDPEISSMKEGGSIDAFREKMRELAWEKAMENPWLGEGFRIDLADTAGFGANTLDQDPTTLLSVGRAWHSFWLGLAADMGFFAWPIYILIYLVAIVTAIWVIKNSPLASSRRTLAQMMLTLIIVSLLRSYTSGHSANTPFGEWWMFGVLVAMKYSILEEIRAARNTTEAVAESKPVVEMDRRLT